MRCTCVGLRKCPVVTCVLQPTDYKDLEVSIVWLVCERSVLCCSLQATRT